MMPRAFCRRWPLEQVEGASGIVESEGAKYCVKRGTLSRLRRLLSNPPRTDAAGRTSRSFLLQPPGSDKVLRDM